jgi:hypothetical protein
MTGVLATVHVVQHPGPQFLPDLGCRKPTGFLQPLPPQGPVLAASDATRQELERVIELTMRAWPH